MLEKKLKYKKYLTILSAITLILAVPPIWPYAYYQLLRWVVAGTAIFVAYLAHGAEKSGWMWTMIVVTILFNPLVPFFLSKGTWVVLDVVVASIFILSLRKT